MTVDWSILYLKTARSISGALFLVNKLFLVRFALVYIRYGYMLFMACKAKKTKAAPAADAKDAKKKE